MNVEYFKHRPYEDADADGYSGAFKTRDYDGVAWRVIGWELEPLSTWQCCDCGACGYERDGGGGKTIDDGDPDCNHEDIDWNAEPEYERTGALICIMIGDDRPFIYDPSDLTRIAETDYCCSCGQIGCCADGRAH